MELKRINDTTLAVQDGGGANPAVLFVHGLGGTLYCWWAQLAAAAERGYRAIAHDARGAGLSDVPPGPYSVEGWADDAVALLDALEIEQAALVGHSVGCMVAQQAAMKLGERCWALVAVGGTLAWPEAGAPVFEQRAALARGGRMWENAEAVAAGALTEEGRAADPRLHGLVLRLVASNDPEGYALSAIATGRGRMRTPEDLRCPVLALTGSEDRATSPAAAAAIAEAVPNGTVEVLDGLAHWCMLERPDLVNDALFNFLDAVRR
jgi:pimeloyl-ACP methyl ester carboxylesterase